MADESKARHLLGEMQMRLARSPYDALDIPAGAPTQEQVRAAFIRLSKLFHPHKFAQMSTEIQKQATEVFLSLRAAYDSLSKPKASVRQSGMQPALPKDGRPPPPSSALNPPTQRNAPPAPSSALNPPTQRGSSSASSSTQIPAQRAPTAPAAPTTPTTTRPPTPQPMRALTPPGGVPAPPIAKSNPQPNGPPAPTESPELGPVYEALNKGNWESARAALKSLLALKPDTARYQALIHYANGREAMAEGRVNDARVDLNDALRSDSQLQIAKTAFQELMGRRK